MDSVWTVFIVMCAAFVIFCTWLVYSQVQKFKGDNRASKYQEDYIRDNNITCTKDLSYCSYGYRCRFIADDLTRTVYMYSDRTSESFVAVPYHGIWGMNVFQDGMETGSIGRSIVGGMFAGDVGAYLGATRGTHYITSYKAVVGIKSVSNPKFEFVFFDGPRISQVSSTYNEARDFVNEMQATINAIRFIR